MYSALLKLSFALTRAKEEQVLFLDEAPQPERATSDACVRSLICVCLVECAVEWEWQTYTQVSMMDIDIFRAISGVMSTAHDARRKTENRGREHHDEFGDVHIILFGDFKCLP